MHLPVILGAAHEIEERINRIPRSHSIKISDLATSPKHLLFFLCDLLAVIYPATTEMIDYYLAQICPTLPASDINVPTLIGLGVAMNLLRSRKVTDGGSTEAYYGPAESARADRPFHHSRLLYLEGQRAAHVSVLLAIPQAKAVLSDIREDCMIIERMAADLGVTATYIENLARGASYAYKSYPIPKRGGGKRTIHHPSKPLKGLQRWLLTEVVEGLPVHSAAVAYQKNKSILDNAAAHVTSKFLLRMDFTKFFPSITEADLRLYIAERPLLFVDWAALDIELFCKLVCRKSVLTIGAPTSPAVSNAICYDMDSSLAALCSKRGVRYTRYADDLFFSTRRPDILRQLEEDVGTLVTNLRLPGSLTINTAKTRHVSKRRVRRVTGIILGSDERPHIGRALKRRIRALIHKIDSLDAAARSSLAGMLAYATGFDPDFMNSLITKYGHPVMRRARTPSA